MALIEIFDGSFPAQSAMLLKKSAFVKQATLALRDADKQKIFYNAHNAIQSVEIVTPDDKKPGIKIILKDGKTIIAKTDHKMIEDIRLIIAAGPDETGDLFIEQKVKKSENEKSDSPVTKTGRFFTWSIGIFFGICTLTAYNMSSWYTGTVFLLVAIAIIPPVLDRLPLFRIRKPSSKIASILILGMVAFILVILFPSFATKKIDEASGQYTQAEYISPTPKKNGKTPTQRDASVVATTLCEMRVERGLRAPRTAKFPWSKEVSFDGKTARLVSYVDAENGFGAMIRTHFVCTIEYIGGKPMETSSWRLTDLAMLD